MANKESAKKKARQDIERNMRNRDRVNRVRTALRGVEEAIKAGVHAPAMNAFKIAMTELHVAAGRGYIRKQTASRRIARLNARVKKLAA